MLWKFGRRTVRPVFSLSAFKPCVEILPARIGTAFGSSWRNRRRCLRRSESGIRKAGIIVEAFDSLAPANLALWASRLCRWRPRRSAVPNAWRLAETPYSFRCGLADYA